MQLKQNYHNEQRMNVSSFLFRQSSKVNSKMTSRSQLPLRTSTSTTGIPVRTSTPAASVARAILFPTPASGSEVASPSTAPRVSNNNNNTAVENVKKENDGNESSSSSDNDDVLDQCIKVAWLKNGDENKQKFLSRTSRLGRRVEGEGVPTTSSNAQATPTSSTSGARHHQVKKYSKEEECMFFKYIIVSLSVQEGVSLSVHFLGLVIITHWASYISTKKWLRPRLCYPYFVRIMRNLWINFVPILNQTRVCLGIGTVPITRP